MPKVLNVGGNSKEIPLPDLYGGWEQILLDIDPKNGPDIVGDARDLFKIKDRFFSVYCSHTLEHFYPHDVPKVLKGFLHVLNKDGFVYIRVPDLMEVIRKVASGVKLDDTLYLSPMGPIMPMDMIYGHHGEIERSGQDWFAHKIGYSPEIMRKYLTEAGFKNIFIKADNLELTVIASNKLTKNPFEI